MLTLPIYPDYEIVNSQDHVTLPPDVVKDLSNDQKHGYKMVKAVTSGVLPMEMAHCAIGLIDHSRWLTTANRFLHFWVSQHCVTGENFYRLRVIIKFIVGVYYPMWFMIKNLAQLDSRSSSCPAQVCEGNEPKRPGPDWEIHKVQCL